MLQFASGFANGYLLGVAWTGLRGPSLKVESRAIAWGLDFGFLPMLFSCTQSLSDLALAFQTKGTDGEEGNGGGRNPLLWSVVLRNMLLAMYFTRRAGVVRAARSAVLYGGLTLFFVRKRLELNATMGAPYLGNVNGAGTGDSRPSPEIMAQVLAQAMRVNGAVPFATAVGTRPSSRKGATSTSEHRKENSIREGAMDVEFEKVVEDNDDSM